MRYFVAMLMYVLWVCEAKADPPTSLTGINSPPGLKAQKLKSIRLDPNWRVAQGLDQPRYNEDRNEMDHWSFSVTFHWPKKPDRGRVSLCMQRDEICGGSN